MEYLNLVLWYVWQILQKYWDFCNQITPWEKWKLVTTRCQRLLRWVLTFSVMYKNKRSKESTGASLTQWQQNNPEFSLFFIVFHDLEGQRKIYADFIHNKYRQLSLQSTVTTMNPHSSWTKGTVAGNTHCRMQHGTQVMWSHSGGMFVYNIQCRDVVSITAQEWRADQNRFTSRSCWGTVMLSSFRVAT